MKKPMKLSVGDIVTTKKSHPCGSKEFTLTRVGMDIRMKCHGCEKEIWIQRPDLEKRIKTIESPSSQLHLIKLSEAYQEQLQQYQKEIIQSQDIDGSGGLAEAKDVSVWIEERCNQPLEYKGEKIPREVYLLIRAEDNYVVGMGQLRFNMPTDLEKSIGHIGFSIRPAERNKGYGKKILQELLLIAKQRGLGKVTLTCRDGNEKSKRTILSCGGKYLSNTIHIIRNIEMECYEIVLG